MMFSARRSITLLLPLVLTLSQSACTLLGRSIGASIDARKTQTFAPELFPPDTVTPGKWIEVLLRDGGKLTGKYRGIEPQAAEEYAERYDAFRESLPVSVPLPALGDTAALLMESGDVLEVEFLGFDADSVSVRALQEAGPRRVSAVDIRQLEIHDRDVIAGADLAALLNEGTVPFRTALIITQPGFLGLGTRSKRTVPPREIVLISVTPRTARNWGTAIGLAVDVTISLIVLGLTDTIDLLFLAS